MDSELLNDKFLFIEKTGFWSLWKITIWLRIKKFTFVENFWRFFPPLKLLECWIHWTSNPIWDVILLKKMRALWFSLIRRREEKIRRIIEKNYPNIITYYSRYSILRDFSCQWPPQFISILDIDLLNYKFAGNFTRTVLWSDFKNPKKNPDKIKTLIHHSNSITLSFQWTLEQETLYSEVLSY